MDPGSVKIFTIRDVPRLRYITELIIGEILGLSWEIVTDKRKLGKHPVINYSNEVLNGSLWILPHGLLSETGINNPNPVVSEWKGLPVFFQSGTGNDLPFDIFATSFFLISRYEEYMPFEPDQYGRFSALHSFAFRNNFLTRPVIDLWTKELAKALLSRFQHLSFKRNVFRSLLTLDVDQPFAYLGKDLFRSIGGLLKDMSNNSGKAAQRYRTVIRGEKDPYDVFDYIFGIIDKYRPEVRFFLPTGNHSVYDKNPSWQNDEYRKLINSISGKFSIGLHPSFAASNSESVLQEEKRRLQNIVSKDILLNRFHYIKMIFPGSYRNLIKAGINEDYSMGYPEEPGFRASIARPFFFYDITEEKKTSLKIIPFQVMDGTLFKYRALTPGASDEIIAGIIEETRKSGGLFVSIWHNTSLLDNEEWRGWRNTFETHVKTSAAMIVYLKNPEIDRDQWDNCIKASQSFKPYAYSWYLDIMAPGWEALVDDDYDSVFPVPGFSRFGIKYVTTPIFLQQLGAFSPDESSDTAINEFLDYMPEFYELIDLCVGQKVSYKGFKVTERFNYEIDLSKPYEVLCNKFSIACRRNIEKSSRKKIDLVEDISPGELIDLFIRNKEDIARNIKQRDFERLHNLMEYCLKNKKGRITGVRASRHKILFGQFIIETPGSINLFFGVNTHESREKRINYYVVNEVIKNNASRELMLDFAGSSIPSVASFMESFGSSNNPYYRIFRNNLPWPIRMLK